MSTIHFIPCCHPARFLFLKCRRPVTVMTTTDSEGAAALHAVACTPDAPTTPSRRAELQHIMFNMMRACHGAT
jgi:hypothetical protein